MNSVENTVKFEFYVPFVNTKEAVSKYIEVNAAMTKAVIKAVYAKCSLDGFDDNFKQNILTLKEHDINVILDLEFSHKIDDKWLCDNEPKLVALVDKWIELGFSDVLLTNIQLMEYLSFKFPSIELYGSYKQNLSSMKQYLNLTTEIQKLKSVSPACAVNHNLKFLKNLKSFLTMDIQVVVNNGCKPMCYKTFTHHSWYDAKVAKGLLNESYDRWTSFYYDCFAEYKSDFWKNFIMSDMIYPWQLKDLFEETGVRSFRLLPQRNYLQLPTEYILGFIVTYLGVLENYEQFKNMPFHFINGYLLDKIPDNEISLHQVRPFIPDLSFFKHEQGSCGDRCQLTCFRCNDIAKKMAEAFSIGSSTL